MGWKEEFTWQVPSCLPYLKDQAHTTRNNLYCTCRLCHPASTGARSATPELCGAVLHPRSEAEKESVPRRVWFITREAAATARYWLRWSRRPASRGRAREHLVQEAHGVQRLREGMFHTTGCEEDETFKKFFHTGLKARVNSSPENHSQL